MPSFCRHNRFVQNCPICSKDIPADSPLASKTRAARPAGASTASRPGSSKGPSKRRATSGVTVSKLERAEDDGYRSSYVPGLRASADAERLAEEIAFAVARLGELATDPPGLYGVAAAEADREEAVWLAFQIAWIGPAEEGDPFVQIEAARVSWASGEVPNLEGIVTGPRGAADPARADATITAYRAWATKAGGQQLVFEGESYWPAERRFERAFERLGSLPGLTRSSRYDLLVILGRLGLVDARGGSLLIDGKGTDEVTVAAKRVFGIGDPILIERRAKELVEAGEVPAEALDLALESWGTGTRVRLGASDAVEPDEAVFARVGAALGV